ncbi:MAG TPA: hypothetical protein VEB59_14365, partial [Gemmatimonadales bacterium]|nr:hypothetical protein [Gemmatimonadales bacterium]
MRSSAHLSKVLVPAVLLLALGCGEDPQAPTPEGTAVEPGPALATAALTFRQISAGDAHTCAVVTGADSAAYCWGYNLNGQLGDVTTDSRSRPGLVRGQLHWRTVMAGPSHTCGVAGDGKAYCWGSNALGQLGANVSTSAPQRTPVQV